MKKRQFGSAMGCTGESATAAEISNDTVLVRSISRCMNMEVEKNRNEKKKVKLYNRLNWSVGWRANNWFGGFVGEMEIDFSSHSIVFSLLSYFSRVLLALCTGYECAIRNCVKKETQRWREMVRKGHGKVETSIIATVELDRSFVQLLFARCFGSLFLFRSFALRIIRGVRHEQPWPVTVESIIV